MFVNAFLLASLGAVMVGESGSSVVWVWDGQDTLCCAVVFCLWIRSWRTVDRSTLLVDRISSRLVKSRSSLIV